MGLLDNVLGGSRGSGGGGPSGITLALMALLAYRTYQGKGRLAEMLGRVSQLRAGNLRTLNRQIGRMGSEGYLAD